MQLGDTPLIKITGDKLQTILDDYEEGSLVWYPALQDGA